jgi:hypothetical protein
MGLTVLPFFSPQVTPQGGAGTLPLSQASSSLSTTGQRWGAADSEGTGGTLHGLQSEVFQWFWVDMGLKAESQGGKGI